LSDTVTAKFIAHGYHWNVMGSDFTQFHDFFATIYESFDTAIDPLAEYLLKNGYDAPYMLTDFCEMSCIKEERIEDGDPRVMVLSLIRIVETLKVEATKLFDIADELNAQDIANYAAELLDGYNKNLWQLKATINVR
jgi:starvation-inducible DNA-binding protein